MPEDLLHGIITDVIVIRKEPNMATSGLPCALKDVLVVPKILAIGNVPERNSAVLLERGVNGALSG
jgi:hypothetical protein